MSRMNFKTGCSLGEDIDDALLYTIDTHSLCYHFIELLHSIFLYALQEVAMNIRNASKMLSIDNVAQ